jgi:calcineurin-like phosphoesterase family protein
MLCLSISVLAITALLVVSTAAPRSHAVRVRVKPATVRAGDRLVVTAAVRPIGKRCTGSATGAGAPPIRLAAKKAHRGVVTWRWTVSHAAKGGRGIARVKCAGAGVGTAHFTVTPQPPPPPPVNDPVIAAVGDIACDPATRAFNGGNGTATNCRQKAVSDLVVNAGYTAILALGDNQYEDGAYSKFLQSYDLSWGRVKPITHPAAGNHEYLTTDASGYFQYFGAAAGAPSEGYYSYDIGSWHMIALNSQCSKAGGCKAGNRQEVWLRQVLAAHANRCVLAYWHHPRFSSGPHGSHTQMATIWNDLVTGGADVVLTGHDHSYERFEPAGVTPATAGEPTLDPNGIRSFVVGTGGKNLTRFTRPPLAGAVVRNDQTYGVLRMTLHPESYDWRFVPEAGKTFTDAGSARCD